MSKQEFIKRILLKISSTKFWVMVASFVTSILVLFNVAETTQTQIATIITTFGTIVVYMISNVAQKSSTTTTTEG